jgi:hypothetical protein
LETSSAIWIDGVQKGDLSVLGQRLLQTKGELPLVPAWALPEDFPTRDQGRQVCKGTYDPDGDQATIGFGLLDIAAGMGSAESFKYLNVFHAMEVTEVTMRVAVAGGNAEICRLAWDAATAKVHNIRKLAKTALEYGRFEILRWLLSQGADAACLDFIAIEAARVRSAGALLTLAELGYDFAQADVEVLAALIEWTSMRLIETLPAPDTATWLSLMFKARRGRQQLLNRAERLPDGMAQVAFDSACAPQLHREDRKLAPVFAHLATVFDRGERVDASWTILLKLVDPHGCPESCASSEFPAWLAIGVDPNARVPAPAYRDRGKMIPLLLARVA